MREINRLRLKIASIPLLILFAMIFGPIPLYLRGIFNYFAVMPLVIFLSAFFVFFIGAWWDFGAKEYLKELFTQGSPVSDEDIKFINRQQLIITFIFIGIGAVYMLVAYVLSLI